MPQSNPSPVSLFYCQKCLPKILEQGTMPWVCPKWATSFYQIVHIWLHLRLPSPTQPPAAYLDSLKQNKSTIPSQSHLTPLCLQRHALCLQGFAWNCWAFHRADAAAWVTASLRNELLHVGYSMETAHGYAWILCNILQGHLHPLEKKYLLHIYPVTQLPGYFWWSICYVISQMKFKWFRTPDSRKKELQIGTLACLPFRLVLFQSLNKIALCKPPLRNDLPEICWPPKHAWELFGVANVMPGTVCRVEEGRGLCSSSQKC